MPPLVYLYWALHCIHAVLALVAIKQWWRTEMLVTCTGHNNGLCATFLLRPINRLLPWFFLALLFWLPGLYLEWPGDPWEHIRRIHEWRHIDYVTAHSSWTKSGYFLFYSLDAFVQAPTSNWGLRLAYTAASLLLTWQYYRLGLIFGLRRSAALLLAITTPLLLGNNAFSFWRYYGFSSSIFGQVAVVAAMRWALATPLPSSVRPTAYFIKDCFRSVLPIGALLALASCNHFQALPTAVLGVVSLIAWRWTKERRFRLIWILATVATASALVVVFVPPDPRWANLVVKSVMAVPWSGLALFDPRSAAFELSLMIIGAFGALNLLAAIWLARENHPASWLIFGPLVLLACPVVAVPILKVLLAAQQPLMVFQRLLFVIPPTLGLVVLGSRLVEYRGPLSAATPTMLLLGSTLGLLLVPINGPHFGRLFNLIAIRAEPEIAVVARMAAALRGTGTELAAVPSTGFWFHAFAGVPVSAPARDAGPTPPARNAEDLAEQLVIGVRPLLLVTLDPSLLVQSGSILGWASGHWLPDFQAMHMMAAFELRALAEMVGGKLTRFPGGTLYELHGSAQFLEAYNQVTISRGAAGPLTFTPPFQQNDLFVLTGKVVQGHAETLGNAPAPFILKQGKPTFILKNKSASESLYLHTSSNFELHLTNLQGRRATDNTRPSRIIPKGEPIVLLGNLRVRSTSAPGGLYIRLTLNPNFGYRFVLRGLPVGQPPTLRIRAVIADSNRLRYLNVESKRVEFLVAGLSAIELLLYQDLPFDYELHSLEVTKEERGHDKLEENIFWTEMAHPTAK